MKPKEQILKFIQKAYEKTPQTDESMPIAGSENKSTQDEIIRELFDGMSTGTARIIIEREISQTFGEEYNIDLLENKGRYYVAKIIRSDGSLIQRLLIDKQTGSVRMVGC